MGSKVVLDLHCTYITWNVAHTFGLKTRLTELSIFAPFHDVTLSGKRRLCSSGSRNAFSYLLLIMTSTCGSSDSNTLVNESSDTESTNDADLDISFETKVRTVCYKEMYSFLSFDT